MQDRNADVTRLSAVRGREGDPLRRAVEGIAADGLGWSGLIVSLMRHIMPWKGKLAATFLFGVLRVVGFMPKRGSVTPKLASRVLRPGRVRTIGPEMPTGKLEPLFDAMSRRKPDGAGSLAMRLINSCAPDTRDGVNSIPVTLAPYLWARYRTVPPSPAQKSATRDPFAI